nr:U-box domain-containing protein 33 isoform X1 [Ipomoea batatas]
MGVAACKHYSRSTHVRSERHGSWPRGSSLVGIEPGFTRNSFPQRELTCHLSYPIGLKKAMYVCEQAPPFCQISFICKGDHIYTRSDDSSTKPAVSFG